MIKIGTRKSELAQWQAKLVQARLADLGTESELVLIESYGDVNLKQPLYELGVTGVFTRSLDIALLNEEIDLAVHSMKDVPVKLPKGIVEMAVMERGNVWDVLVHHQPATKKIATSSLRRKAQWLAKFPDYQIEDLRGNVNTRLNKVAESDWEGAIFAKAGLERIHLLPEEHTLLDWMIPAPAQGALMITGRGGESELSSLVGKLYHTETAFCVKIEREVLHLLEGGCTAPIAVYAQKKGPKTIVDAGVYSLDGSKVAAVHSEFEEENPKQVATKIVEDLNRLGAQEILQTIRNANVG